MVENASQIDEQDDIDYFLGEFNKAYAEQDYKNAYIYAMVLFDDGYREKQFLYNFATSAFHTQVFSIFLERMQGWAAQDDAGHLPHELLAGVLHYFNDEEQNKKHALEYAKKKPLGKLEYEAPRLHVVVLQTVASGVYRFDPQRQSFNIPEGHNNLNSMLAPFINQYTLAVDDLEAAKAALGSLEKVDVIYNSITDPDRCTAALENASLLCDAFTHIPVVNHPRAVLQTTRDNNYHRFHNNRHIIYPKNVKLPMVDGDCHAQITQAIVDNNLSYPVIARLSGFQGGKNMHLIHSSEEHDFADFDAAVKDSPKDIYIIEYIEVSFKDRRAPESTFYPKFRAFLAGGKLYPVNFYVAADNYNVHLANSNPTKKKYPWLIGIEKQYCNSPTQVIHRNLWKALEKMMSKAGLDYIGVDFAIGKDKKGNEGVVIFEANAAMRNWMKDAHYTHERVAWEKVTRRMHHVFCDKAGVPTWNFHLPLDIN